MFKFKITWSFYGLILTMGPFSLSPVSSILQRFHFMYIRIYGICCTSLKSNIAITCSLYFANVLLYSILWLCCVPLYRISISSGIPVFDIRCLCQLVNSNICVGASSKNIEFSNFIAEFDSSCTLNLKLGTIPSD